MRVVVQRVSEAAVTVGDREVARIGRGFVVLAGFAPGDNDDTIEWMARKVSALRVFSDDAGKMSLGLDAVGGRILVVSQFTLYADTRKGNRPSFTGGADPDVARRLYERFVALLERELPGHVATGEFQASMKVALVNDGPVTITIERGAGEGA